MSMKNDELNNPFKHQRKTHNSERHVGEHLDPYNRLPAERLRRSGWPFRRVTECIARRSRRITAFVGRNPAEGPVARMITWAHAQPDEILKVIHVRDWHDSSDPKQRSHLEQFGRHCLRNSIGAEFVFDIQNVHPDKRLEIVDATTLSNFVDARLDEVLRPYRTTAVCVGLMGVWTEAKITFLGYDLRSRYPHFRLAVCSALTASSSRENHFV